MQTKVRCKSQMSLLVGKYIKRETEHLKRISKPTSTKSKEVPEMHASCAKEPTHECNIIVRLVFQLFYKKVFWKTPSKQFQSPTFERIVLDSIGCTDIEMQVVASDRHKGDINDEKQTSRIRSNGRK